MEASGWTNFWLVVIVIALICLNGKIRRLSHSISSSSDHANKGNHSISESIRQAIGECVELEFSTGGQDTVFILDVDDYCVLAECAQTSCGCPIGTQWVLPLKDIISIRVLL